MSTFDHRSVLITGGGTELGAPKAVRTERVELEQRQHIAYRHPHQTPFHQSDK